MIPSYSRFQNFGGTQPAAARAETQATRTRTLSASTRQFAGRDRVALRQEQSFSDVLASTEARGSYSPGSTRRQEVATSTVEAPTNSRRGDQTSSQVRRTSPAAASPAATSPPTSGTTSSGTPTDSAARGAATTNPEATLPFGQRAVNSLRQRLQSVNPLVANAPMEYMEEPVYFPGGVYYNRLIKVTGTNGRTEFYDANLVTRNPDIAANEISRIFT